METTALNGLTYAIGTATVLVNLFSIIIGIKSISKKTHNILVLCLSISDGLHGISVLFLADSLMEKRGTRLDTNINVPACIVKLALYFSTIGLSLTILLFISIERYITVKHFNFAPSGLTLKKRYVIIGLIIGLVWAYILIWILSAQVNDKNVECCKIGVIYDEDAIDVNGWAIICLYTSMIAANLVLYGKTTYRLYRMFRKPTLNSGRQSTAKVGHFINALDSPKPSTSSNPENETTITPPRKISLWITASDRYLNKRMSYPRVNVTTRKSKYFTSLSMDPIPIEGNNEVISLPSTSRRRKMSNVFSMWERRAMITNFYLIVDHVVFFLPMICLLVADRLDVNIPDIVLMIGQLWLLLHFLINPFIFAWRIKEINAELRKIIRCKNKITPFVQQFQN